VSGQVSPGGSFTLSVAVTGTAPFVYEWWDATHGGGSIGTGASITVSPTSTTQYYAGVSNPCGYEISQTAKVAVNECPAPSTGQIQAVLQPDGSWILKPNPIARQPRTYGWVRLSDNMAMGTSETLVVGVLATTTTYRLTITDNCNLPASGEVTISVPLPITTGLVATATSQNQVSLTWPAISGATVYTVERRSGSTWDFIATAAVPNFVDNTVAPSQTYAYHVRSNNGGSTDYKVATTMSFVAAVSGQQVTTMPINDMLTAVNKVRAAAGWPGLTWSNILASSDPLPQPNALITARHIMSCRSRMNEALQALGVIVQEYSDPDLFHVAIKDVNINEVQQRAHGRP